MIHAQSARFDASRTSLLLAGPERAEEIARIHARLFNPAWTEDSIRALLMHPAGLNLVATAGTPLQAAGFIIAQIAADEAEILSIGVAEDAQRRGIGRRLVEGLMRAAERAGAERIFLEVAADNMAAIALYAKLGFSEVGRRKGYYERSDAPAADAIAMRRALSVRS